MPNRIKLFGLLTILLATGVLIIFYSPILKNPNSTLFSLYYDGIKNYNTFVYHAKYDDSYTHFNGHNYPYGDSVLFPDLQPIFSGGIKFISNNTVDISDYSVGILNLAMLFLLIPTALLLYLILIRVKLPAWYSMLVAVGIAFLSPQIHRFTIGHWGLSYTIIIPLAWYLLLKFYDTRSYIFSLFYMANTIIWGGAHLQHVFTLSLFAAVFLGITYLKDSERFTLFKTVPHFLIQVCVPLLTFKLFVMFTVTKMDRMVSKGVFRHHIEGLLLPYRTIFINIFEHFIKIRNLNHEDLNYIGVVGVFLLLFLIVRSARFLKKRNFSHVTRLTGNKPLMISLLTAFIILILSMADPFRYLPVVEQFRSSGRLVWVFYYVFTVFAFYTIYLMRRYLLIKGLKLAAKTLLIASMMLLFMDAAILNRNISRGINNRVPELQDKTYTLPLTEWMKHVDYKQYQAIIPLPYFHEGSETPHLNREGTTSLRFMAFILSMKTGLPLTAVQMARTPVSDTEKQIEFFNPDIKNKRIIQDYPNQKPFLIIATYDKLPPEETLLLEKARLLFQNDKMQVFELPFDRII